MDKISFESMDKVLGFELTENKAILVSIESHTIVKDKKNFYAYKALQTISKPDFLNIFSFFTSNITEFVSEEEMDKVITYLVQQRAKMKGYID